MRKKIALGVVAAGSALALLPLFAAFEAHVVNVTAKIENALNVPIEALNFGTVFPQEHLDLDLRIALSQSFLEEDRVDDVDYFIRQKPKCGVTNENGTELVGPTWTGHIVVTGDQVSGFTYEIDCEQDRPENVPPSPVIGDDPNQVVDVDFYLLPSLCEYISKHPDGVDDNGQPSTNDGSLNSFHQPFSFSTSTGVIDWNDTLGRLAKSEDDETDLWTIDLAVPCFGGFCAQDWEEFVAGINPDADPDLYTQPIANEHKIFGCNLWVEVYGVSTSTPVDPDPQDP